MRFPMLKKEVCTSLEQCIFFYLYCSKKINDNVIICHWKIISIFYSPAIQGHRIFTLCFFFLFCLFSLWIFRSRKTLLIYCSTLRLTLVILSGMHRLHVFLAKNQSVRKVKWRRINMSIEFNVKTLVRL